MGTFYRAPNSSRDTWDLREQPIEYAVDTNLSLIITGDVNDNQLRNSSSKMRDILQNYNLKQLIAIPTSFTEHSSTLIDLFITNVQELIEHCDVGDPFLDVNVRYHCPIFGMLKITKPKISSVKRKIWIYDKGNYQLYREKLQN